MTESEIAELEAATSLVLPESYRRLLLDYPAFPESVLDPEFRPQEDELYASRDLLWDANVEGAASLRKIFPASYFVIGESGCGDYYAIDTQHPDSPVYISGPHQGEYPQDEHGKRLPSYPSINQFVDFISEEIRKWDGGQADSRPDSRPRTVLSFLLAGFTLVCGLGFMLLTSAVVIPVAWLVRRFSRTFRDAR